MTEHYIQLVLCLTLLLPGCTRDRGVEKQDVSQAAPPDSAQVASVPKNLFIRGGPGETGVYFKATYLSDSNAWFVAEGTTPVQLVMTNRDGMTKTIKIESKDHKIRQQPISSD